MGIKAMLLLMLIATDWTAWYAAQVKLRSASPRPDQMHWMAKASDECAAGDVTTCALYAHVSHVRPAGVDRCRGYRFAEVP